MRTRSDSTVVIQRAKDTRAGLGQEVAIEIRKLRSKIKGNVYIEWIKRHDGDKGNQIVAKMAKEMRSNSQRTTMILYLITMISRRATRDNYPGVPSKYYLFKYISLRRSDLDEDRRTISTVNRLRGNGMVIGSFLHRIKRAEFERC